MMKTIDKLYEIADENDITIYNFELEKIKSMSLMDAKGNCHIAVDIRQIKNSHDEKVILAHELGHCIKGAFYSKYSKYDIVERHEYRANRWAVDELLPFYRLRSAFEIGIAEVWELADFFELPETFILIAIEHYEHQGLLPDCN